MACQCGTATAGAAGVDAAAAGCGCGSGTDAACDCGTGGTDAGVSLERLVMELDKRVRRLEAQRSSTAA